MTTLTFLEAALKILAENGGKPMHYREVADRAVGRGLVETRGETPEATFGAILYTHVKKARASGKPPKVVAHGDGRFSIAGDSRSSLDAMIEENNKLVRKKLLDNLHEMDPVAFEQLIGSLLTEIGFDSVAVTKKSGDGGLDVIADLTVGGVTKVRTAVQVKRWKHNVPDKIVRELRGALEADQRGLIVATSKFTSAARNEADAPNKVSISLIDGQRLVDLLVENQLGIKMKQVAYIELDFEQISELETEVSGRTSTASAGKALGLWPVPGGIENYVSSAVQMLSFVSKNSPTMDEMVAWVQSNFDKANAPPTIRGYVRVLRTLGLVRFDGEEVLLSEPGSRALQGNADEVIADELESRVAGISEILALLKGGPRTKREIHDHLLKTLDVKWSTQAQTDFRVNWLASAGSIRRSGSKYSLA